MAGKWMWSCIGPLSGFSSVASYWSCWSNWPWAKCRKEMLSAILILHMASVAAVSVIKLPLKTFMACSVQTLACRPGITVALAPVCKCLEKASFKMLCTLWRKGLRLPECLPLSNGQCFSTVCVRDPSACPTPHLLSHCCSCWWTRIWPPAQSKHSLLLFQPVTSETPVTDQWLFTLWWNISQKVPQASVMLSLPSVGFSGG